VKLSIFLACLLISSFSKAEVVDRIVAVINNEIVTLSELRSFAARVDRNGMIDDLLLFGQRPESLKGNQKAELDYLINERILDSEIKRLNLSVTIERVEQEIRDIARKNGVTRADLMSAIKAQGMSPSEYQDFIKNRIERQSLIEQEITSKIRVSDEDVMAEYARANPNTQGGVYEYSLAHIFFNPKKGGADAALQRAKSALAKIRTGNAFETVAEQTSEDTNFTGGGLLGTFKAGELNPEMDKSLQGLSVGDVTEVVQTKGGIHILKILSKKVVTDPRFDREKEKIRSQLFEAAFQKHFRSWIQTKREDSFIRINQ
jgi:peptidyl-prolyl cis-trans isomerase SurA